MRIRLGIALALAVSACAGEPMLVFGQSQTVGLTIGASTTEQRGELSLGYKDYDVAVVPTQTLSQAGDHADSLSVIGQFEVDGGAEGAAPRVGLGKFFATGLAAKTLADGFRCQVSEGRHESCTQH
jgi:hypothetical protein